MQPKNKYDLMDKNPCDFSGNPDKIMIYQKFAKELTIALCFNNSITDLTIEKAE